MSNELLEFEKDKTVRDKLLNDIKFSKDLIMMKIIFLMLVVLVFMKL